MSTISLPLTGFNRVALGLEIRRVLRNRRTLIFTLLMPATFFAFFGLPYHARSSGAAFAGIMVNMATYGAMVAATSCGAAVAVERGQGWNRQLRLTPLRPLAYVTLKSLTALVLALLSVLVVFVVGAACGVRMAGPLWLLCAAGAWLGALVFAAFGLFVGFSFPSENVMQIVGPLMALLSMCGGVFIPLALLPDAIRAIAVYTPMYGVAQLARAPLEHGVQPSALANAVVWGGLFATGAMLLFRRTTGRS